MSDEMQTLRESIEKLLADLESPEANAFAMNDAILHGKYGDGWKAALVFVKTELRRALKSTAH